METAPVEAPQGHLAGGQGLLGGAQGLLASAQDLWQSWRDLLADHLQLAALEGRQAGETLAALLALGLLGGALLIGLWLSLAAALLLWLYQLGITLPLALLLLAVFHGVALSVVLRVARRRSRGLGFEATLRNLRVAP